MPLVNMHENHSLKSLVLWRCPHPEQAATLADSWSVLRSGTRTMNMTVCRVTLRCDGGVAGGV